MKRRDFIALGALPWIAAAQQRGDATGAAHDLLNQALEMLWEHSTNQQIEKARHLINFALDENPGFGDAHYYRALCCQRLKLPGVASGLEAAETFKSEAFRDKRDPFKLSAPGMENADLTRMGQKWALVVGINKFQPKKGADPLRFAAADASAFADLLEDPKVGRFPPEQVFRLIDEEATTPAIKARLNRIATKAKSEDLVVVYISTHGSSRSDDLKQVSYLYTHDTDVTSRDQVFGTALPMVELSGIISTRCAALRTAVILDTCHSGSVLRDQALSKAEFDRLRAGAGRYVISSCGESERSYEDNGHGLFTASLIARLAERNGCVRLREAFQQVEKDVSEKAQKRSLAQKPVMIQSDKAAEILLGANPGDKSDGCAAMI